MKKILLLTGIMVGILFCSYGQQNYSESYAAKVALRLRDSLSLTESNRVRIYKINLDISNQKKKVWRQFAGADTLITINLQRIENTRDSLYRTVLNEEEFYQYRQKKVFLINNN